MPSPQSLRRLANLTKKVRDDLRSGGMAVNFRYLFRSTAILARVVEILADHMATEAEEKQARSDAAERAITGALEEALERGTGEEVAAAASPQSDAAEDDPPALPGSARTSRAAADS